jgi:calcineurin-like phosphoesterase family protein
MSYNIFFISDTHFGHEAPYTKFTQADGCTMLRPHGSAAAGDEAMVENWNKIVRPNDRVYHLGDIAMSKRHLPMLARLSGRKVLIRGNHDIEKLSAYTPYFDDIRGVHQFSGMILSHIPVHPDSLSRWKLNVHGHLHGNKVTKRKYVSEDGLRSSAEIVSDPRYFNVSVEQINYTPISLEEVKKLSGMFINE